MLVKGSNFIESVKFLQRFHDRKEESVPPNPLPTERPSAQPVSIGEIFKAMGTAGSSVSKNQKANDNQPFNQLNQRIIQLEQKVVYLTQRLKIIELNS